MCLGFSSLTESVLETTWKLLQMTHAASSGSLATLGLRSPGIAAHLGTWIGTLGTGVLLLVEGTVSTAAADCVRLCVAFTKTGGSFGLHLGWMDGVG